MTDDGLAREQDTLLAYLDSAKRELLQKPNTLAVGIGIKETDGQFTGEIAYRSSW